MKERIAFEDFINLACNGYLVTDSTPPQVPAPVFGVLDIWLDDKPRTGAMNMAIDQLLMEQVTDVPRLRVYGWSEATVSFGYFMSLDSAKAEFSDEGLHYVRRWTGGGIVDHRSDVTYTLVIPRAHPLALARGSESYQLIHELLSAALVSLGENVSFLNELESQGDGGCACFTNPVEYDLLGESGKKVAGAGQKRTRQGLLHQGSVSLDVKADCFLQSLAEKMSHNMTTMKPNEEFFQQAEVLASQRYASAAWLQKK